MIRAAVLAAALVLAPIGVRAESAPTIMLDPEPPPPDTRTTVSGCGYEPTQRWAFTAEAQTAGWGYYHVTVSWIPPATIDLMAPELGCFRFSWRTRRPALYTLRTWQHDPVAGTWVQRAQREVLVQ